MTQQNVKFPNVGGPTGDQIGVAESLPLIPVESYAARADAAYARAGADWVLVYADREHVANMMHLTNFEPRFEEALLLLGPNGRRVLVVGNESMDYTPVARLPGLELVLAQSLSLMAQPRETAPSLTAVLEGIGLAKGEKVGIVGWKYLEAAEQPDAAPRFLVPHSILASVVDAVGDWSLLSEATPVFMHPETGERTVVCADQIAVLEWAASRASAAVSRIVAGAAPGMTEFETAALMGYQGEPLSCHMMMASSQPDGSIIGLRSPTAKRLVEGEGVTTAVGYWGALSSRAGVLGGAADKPGYMDRVHCYFAALLTWYRTAAIGVEGGTIHAAVTEALAKGGLRPALNPGHLLGYDEWSHSPVRPGSTEKIRSGMPFQVDIIPTPMGKNEALNCEDAVVFADAALRADIAARHPQVWARIEARRARIKALVGFEVPEYILPLSNNALELAPDWTQPDCIVTLADLEG